MELQVAGVGNAVSDEIRDGSETSGGDHNRHDRESIEAIRQINGIRGADHNEYSERDEEPAEVDQDVLEERNDQAVRKRCQRDHHHPVSRDCRDIDFQYEFDAAG